MEPAAEAQIESRSDHPRRGDSAPIAAHGRGHAEERSRSVLVIAGAGGLLAAVIFAVFWDFLVRQVLFAIEQQADWGHTLVIPFIAAYFVYMNRSKWLGRDGRLFRTTWLGLVPIVLGVAWYIFTAVGPQALNHHNLKAAGLAATLFGLALLFFGWRGMRWLWFPLAYLCLFGQTISDQFMHYVTFKMQDVAAVGSEFLFVLIGMDVLRSGNTITLVVNGDLIPLNIAEACSGMRMLMAFLALGVAMAYTGLALSWQRVLLVILAVPIAIFVNMLRVVTLGLLSILDTNFAAGDFHTFVGLIWLIPAFVLFLGVMWAVKKMVIVDEPSDSSMQPSVAPSSDGNAPRFLPRIERPTKLAFATACATLIVSSLGFHAAVAQLNIYLRKERIDVREQFSAIPRTLGQWRAVGTDGHFDAAVVETLGTQVYLSRHYERTEPLTGLPNVPIGLHLAYYTGMIDAVPHIPDRCMSAAGFQPVALPEVIPLDVVQSHWERDSRVHRRSGQHYRRISFDHHITGRPITVRLPIGEFELRVTEFQHDQYGDARIFAGFFFIANGQLTARPLEVRKLAFDRTDKHAYYCKVEFTAQGGMDFDRGDFAALVSDLLNELLPELMRCLPDWAEVEAGPEEPATNAAAALRSGDRLSSIGTVDVKRRRSNHDSFSSLM